VSVTYVSVVGQGAGGDPSPALLEAAAELGRELARAGAVVVCGGLGGVMAAVSRGVCEGGGCCVGLLPGAERAEGNGHLSVSLPTGLGEARNALVVRAGEVVIALGRGYGTLSEIALALRMRKHVVALSSWEVAGEDECMHTVEHPAQAVRLALALCAHTA
jgi:uncharacterized protein (TIGR00725 family)